MCKCITKGCVRLVDMDVSAIYCNKCFIAAGKPRRTETGNSVAVLLSIDNESMSAELSQLRSELERVKKQNDDWTQAVTATPPSCIWASDGTPRHMLDNIVRYAKSDDKGSTWQERAIAAESKLTAAESARRVLVEEIKAARKSLTKDGNMIIKFSAQTFNDKLEYSLARAAVDSLKLLEGEG